MRAIEAVNADGKYKMVFNATALLDAADALDISDVVLAKVNELYEAEKKSAASAEKK
jgi:outer membrane protein